VIGRWFSWVLVAISLTLMPAALWGQAADTQPSPPSGGGEPASLEANPFLVFDAILLKKKPDLTRFGLKPITVLYHYQMWAKDESDEWPNQVRLRVLARQLWRKGHMVCIDTEHWPVYNQPAEVRQASIGKLITVADTLHATAPGLRLGYYALLPQRDYWAPVGKDQARVQAWNEHNEKMRELAEHVDVVFPSLYTFYEDRAGWVAYAEANIAEARRYGKRVYVFLWPWYHESNKERAGQRIPADYWRLELDTCRRLADGVVIWTDPYSQWDPKAGWWEQTRLFMAEQTSEEE